MIVQVHKAGGLDFECLQERHFGQPKVVETYPYEALAVRVPGPRRLLPVMSCLMASDPQSSFMLRISHEHC